MNKLSQILQIRKYGFSLAEALITLLIVCLITLASIPILTKKKRSAENGSSGLYMCTVIPTYHYRRKPFNRGKAEIRYKYVYYNSQSPEGDINNPTTWAVADGDHCKFVPPLNAKNFGVTLIGGGGAGGNGVSKLTPVLNYNIPTFKPEATSEYSISMVGGGAGGAGGSHQSGIAGSGGGSGGFILGKLTLPPGNLYSYEIGEGSADYGNFDSSQSSAPRANNGGDTKFKVSTPSGMKILMTAFGGTGGQTRTCKNRLGIWKCSGGDYSAGGSANIDYGTGYFSNFSGSSGPGYGGSNVLTNDNYSTAGGGISVNGVYYGAGGRGRKDCRSDGCAENGQRGTFSLDRYDIFGGKGGSAAVPLVIPMPKIEGYLKITVGAGGAQFYDLSPDGESTKVEVYNSASKFLRQYVAEGGKAGGQNTQKTPTVGDNSLWNNAAGGAAGTCTEGKSEYYTFEPKDVIAENTQKCKYALGICPHYDASEFNYNIVTMTNGRPSSIRTNRSTETEINRELKKENYQWGAYSFNAKTSGMTVHTVKYNKGGIVDRFISGCNRDAARSLLGLYSGPELVACTEQSILDNNIMPTVNNYVASPDDPEYNKKLLEHMLLAYPRYWAMTTDKRYSIEYECLEYEKENVTISVPVYHPAEPATCARAGSGRYYGSGGGGGAASDTIGVAGQGGYGGPGLVAIEW